MEQEILNQLYRQYSREIYLYLYSFCKNKELAEDLMQDTFLKALLSLKDQHTNMRAWLYMVARNLYFNEQKRQKRKDSYQKQIQDTFIEENVLEGILALEQKRHLYEMLMELDEKKREVLILQYYSELSQKEIAAILHMSPENVRVLAYRGKRDLKKYLEESNYEIS